MRRTVKSDIDYYMNLPYAIEIIPYTGGGFFAKIKELRGCMTEGDTIEEAPMMIEDAKITWLKAALEDGIDIPLPELIKKEGHAERIADDAESCCVNS